jgi:hypothetical protein
MFDNALSAYAPYAKAFLLAVALGVAAPQPAVAAAGPFQEFAGDWSGGGQVIGANGNREQIRCKAQYTPGGGGANLNQSIVCASQSYRLDVESYVEATGESVQGYWREATRDVSGHLTGHISGGHFAGSVTGPSFAAVISLTSNGRKQAVNIRPEGSSDISDVEIELERRG